jgi:hypothetical protein
MDKPRIGDVYRGYAKKKLRIVVGVYGDYAYMVLEGNPLSVEPCRLDMLEKFWEKVE